MKIKVIQENDSTELRAIKDFNGTLYINTYENIMKGLGLWI